MNPLNRTSPDFQFYSRSTVEIAVTLSEGLVGIFFQFYSRSTVE